MTRITPEIATAFAPHSSWLILDGITTLSPEAAREIIKHNGLLSLRGSHKKKLSPTSKTIFAQRKGNIYFGDAWESPNAELTRKNAQKNRMNTTAQAMRCF